MQRIVFSLIISFCFGVAGAQEKAKSLLWEVSGKQLPSPSYVLGTIHMICPDDLIWTANMDTVLTRAGSICMELDMDDPQVLQKMMQGLAANGGGKTVKERLSPKELQQLERFVKDSLGMEIDVIDEMDPATAPLVFLQKLLPCPMPASYEARIATRAFGSKKPILGLETVEEQLALLDKLGTDSSTGELMQLIDSFTTMKSQFRQLINAYKQQDLDSLAKMIEASPILGGQKDAFLFDRNRRWIPRMEGYMAKSPVLFAVGAGHLPGAEGVLQLLRNAGYHVRPLR